LYEARDTFDKVVHVLGSLLSRWLQSFSERPQPDNAKAALG